VADRVHWPRTLVSRGRWTTVAAWLACAAAPALAAPALEGTAGLAGQARAGRWMPVTVSVAAPDAQNGQLTVTWGGAIAHRALALPAGTTRAVTVMLRTGDPRSRVEVAYTGADGRVAATIPVAVVPDDIPIVACIGDTGDPTCTVALTPALAPDDWRAYDTADEVHVLTPGALSTAQRDAVARWAGRHQGEGLFGLPPARDALGGQTPASRVWPWLLLASILPLATAAAVGGRPGRRVLAQYAAIIVATVGAMAAGRIGPTVSFRHATSVHAFAGTDATIVESRLVVDAASDGPLRATLLAPDGWLEAPGPAQRPQQYDEEGHPFVDVAATLGGSYRLDAEFAGQPSPVRVARQADRVSVEHRGATPLTACAFPDSLEAGGRTTIEPGQPLTLMGTVAAGDVISCLWAAGDPPLGGAGGPAMRAPSTLLVHLDTVLP